VVSQDALLDEARAQLDQIFKRAPQTYGLAKRLLTLAASTDLENGLFAETLAQSLLIRTEDHKEGVRAARERRTPSFEGR
jgi:enoyl-CoA hydratase/carnithine racemase